MYGGWQHLGATPRWAVPHPFAGFAKGCGCCFVSLSYPQAKQDNFADAFHQGIEVLGLRMAAVKSGDGPNVIALPRPARSRP